MIKVLFVLRVFQWLLLLPLHLLFWAARYPFSPIAVLFFSTDDRRHLKFPFRWLETQDNDLSGDEGWRNEHIEKNSDPLSNKNRILWLYRNGGQWLQYTIVGAKSIPVIGGIIPPDKMHGLSIRADGYWQWRESFFGIEVYWGWGLWSTINGRIKYVWTIRKSKDA